MMSARNARSGASLVEVLIALGVVFLLLGILVPAVASARSAVQRAACQNNFRQLGLALNSYVGTHGRFPGANEEGKQIGSPLGWQVHILPQMDEEALYKSIMEAFAIDKNTLANPPHVHQTQTVKAYVCPADSRLLEPLTDPSGLTLGLTSYMGIGWSNYHLGILCTDGPFVVQITDGLSNTIANSERPPPANAMAGTWYIGFGGFGRQRTQDGESFHNGPNGRMILTEPQSLPVYSTCVLDGFAFGPGVLDNPCDRYHLWSLHGGGANCLFGDGSCRFFPYSAHRTVLRMGSRDGGELLTD